MVGRKGGMVGSNRSLRARRERGPESARVLAAGWVARAAGLLAAAAPRLATFRAAAAPALIALAGFFMAPAAQAQTAQPQHLASPVGLWKTIDDETRQPKSLVRIVEQDGTLAGRVERILTDKPDAVCEKCTDERRDRPIVGMTIITGMKRVGEQWEGGRILDPANGKVYGSLMRLLDGGRRLEVRGYVGVPMLGRSQTWLREE